MQLVYAFAAADAPDKAVGIRRIVREVQARPVTCNQLVSMECFLNGEPVCEKKKQFTESFRFHLIAALDHCGRERELLLAEEIQQFCCDIVGTGDHREKNGLIERDLFRPGKIRQRINKEVIPAREQGIDCIEQVRPDLLGRKMLHISTSKKVYIKKRRNIF